MDHKRQAWKNMSAGMIGRLVVLAGCALAPAWAALGQNALGDGRLLERNTGNAPLPPVRNRNESFKQQMKLNDSIVTGNSTGGTAFRGNAGYTAADDFRGRLASDDTFRFRRDTLPALSWEQVGSSNLRAQLERTNSLRRFGRDVDGMLGRGNNGKLVPTGVPKSMTDDREAYNLGIGAGSLRSTSSYQLGRALSPSSVGSYNEQNGSTTSTMASGLRGLTVERGSFGLKHKDNPLRDENKVDLYAGQRTSSDEVQERLNKLNLPPMTSDIRSDEVKMLRPGQIDTRAPSDLELRSNREAEKLKNDAGNKGNAGGEGAIPGGQTPNAPTPGSRPGDGPGSRPGDGSLPLNQTDKNQANQNLPGSVRAPGSTLPGDAVRERDPVTGLPSAQAGGEAWRGRMAEIRKALEAEDKARGDAKARKLKGLKPTDSDDPRTPEERSRREAVQNLDRDTIRAIRDSGGTVDKFVSNLSPGGEERDIYSELMNTGQKYLAQGRYFDAEERFIRAAVLRPNDPTALIARLHAQLGAGMVLSASANLRQIIKEHPELIGVRYAPQLLPGGNRLATLQKDLDLTITPTFIERLDLRAKREALLLKAYVGFQLGDRAVIANSLRLMEDTSREMGEDETVLATLLRGVWLDEDLPAVKPIKPPEVPVLNKE